ncbi:hypothetical protein D3C75_1147850 [compost metagenome]
MARMELLKLRVKIEELRPYSLSLARAIPSSRSSMESTSTTGPKISRCRMSMPAWVPATSVGL